MRVSVSCQSHSQNCNSINVTSKFVVLSDTHLCPHSKKMKRSRYPVVQLKWIYCVPKSYIGFCAVMYDPMGNYIFLTSSPVQYMDHCVCTKLAPIVDCKTHKTSLPGSRTICTITLWFSLQIFFHSELYVIICSIVYQNGNFKFTFVEQQPHRIIAF